MKFFLAILFAALSFAASSQGAAVGDVQLGVKSSAGPLEPVWITKTANRALGWNSSGVLGPISISGGSGSSAWADITGTPTTLAGYGITDSITAALAASTYQPLIGTGTLALSKLATDPLARANHTGTQAWSTITSTPTTLAGYGITDSITAALAASTYQPLIADGGLAIAKTSGLQTALDGKLSTATAASTYQPLIADGALTIAKTSGLQTALDGKQATSANLATYSGIAPSANVQTLLGAANYAAFKASLSLGDVENTALSTWAGSTNLTTLGTVTAGTWNASIIAPAYLGTGASISAKFLRGDGTWQTVSATGGTWGTITGTLADQTDLQTALNAKLSTATAASTYQPLIADGTLSLAKLATNPLARANHTGTQDWSTITSTPTTLAGYGISDALTATLAASTYQPLIADGTLSLAKLATNPLDRANHTGTQDVSTITGTLPIAQGGTGQTTAADARNALLPSKTGNASKVLRVKSDETDYELATPAGGAGKVDIQAFTANGTWTKPAGAYGVAEVLMYGGGGGGGSGRSAGAGSARWGGGGGGAGAVVKAHLKVSALAGTEAVTVGAGGNGGAAAHGASDGNPGIAGGDSSFAGLTAVGGNLGGAGTSGTGGTGGAAKTSATMIYQTAAQSSMAGAAGSQTSGSVPVASATRQPTGGAGGAGINAANSSAAGGAGGAQGAAPIGVFAGGAAGASGGGAGGDGSSKYDAGLGGGGGGSDGTGTNPGGPGGAGGLYGGGGGGGAAGVSAVGSGAGGKGGDGYVIIITPIN